jgi:hypothetical protein
MRYAGLGRSGRPAAALTCLAVALVLGACASSDDEQPGRTVSLERALAHTEAADSVRLHMVVDVEGEKIEGYGFADLRGQRSHMTIDVPSAGHFEMVTDHLVIYMKFPDEMLAGSDISDGKPWVSVDLDRAAQSEGIDLQALMGAAGSGDPTEQLDQLRAAGHVEELGQETIRGVEATHLKATIDIAKLVDRVPAKDRPAMRRTAEAMRKVLDGDTTFPVEIWIDGDDRIVRMKQTVETSEEAVDTVVDYYDYGGKGTIEIPLARDVQDVTDAALQADG